MRKESFFEEISEDLINGTAWIISTAIVAGLIGGGIHLLEKKVTEKYNQEMDTNGYYEWEYTSDDKDYMNEYITATAVKQNDGSINYTVPEDYILTQDQSGRYIGVKQYEVIKLVDGTKINVPVEETPEDMDDQFIRKLD